MGRAKTASKRRMKKATPEPVPDERSKLAQIQAYVPPDLLKWIDKDCAVVEREIRDDMGQSADLSRSAYIVQIIHQYRLAKTTHKGTASEFWAKVRRAVTNTKRGSA